MSDDLISRRDAKSKKVYSHERHEYVVPVAELDWLPSAQPEHTETHSCDCERTETHEWIPVTERLPEEQDEYLVTWVIKLHTGKRFVGIGIFEYDLSEDNWLFDDYMNAYVDVTVTAWMPLPEPYKEGQE